MVATIVKVIKVTQTKTPYPPALLSPKPLLYNTSHVIVINWLLQTGAVEEKRNIYLVWKKVVEVEFPPLKLCDWLLSGFLEGDWLPASQLSQLSFCAAQYITALRCLGYLGIWSDVSSCGVIQPLSSQCSLSSSLTFLLSCQFPTF